MKVKFLRSSQGHSGTYTLAPKSPISPGGGLLVYSKDIEAALGEEFRYADLVFIVEDFDKTVQRLDVTKGIANHYRDFH